MDVYKRLEELDIKLLDPTPKGGIYSTVQPYGGHLLYVSGTCLLYTSPSPRDTR